MIWGRAGKPRPGQSDDDDDSWDGWDEHAEARTVGFPSPATDHADLPMDLHRILIAHPEATFFTRAGGNNLVSEGIHDGDHLLVDRSIRPSAGQVAQVVLGGGFALRRLCLLGGRLAMEDPVSKTPLPHPFEVWGIVTFVIHPLPIE